MIRLFYILSLSTMCMANLQVKELSCEYNEYPIGIDCTSPRLSWILESEQNDQMQTAYQVLVATDQKKLLNEEQIDVWDSGKVYSDQSVNIRYTGKKLEGLKKYYWKVRVWDKDGKVSSWSQSGQWLTGFMNGVKFKGNWITFSKLIKHETYNVNIPIDLKGAKWIWYPLEKNINDFGVDTLLFSKQFNVEDINSLKNVRIIITADDDYKININGEFVGSGNNWQTAKLFDLTENIHNGANLIEVEARNNAISPAGLICKIVIEKDNGKDVFVSNSQWNVTRLNQESQNIKVVAKEIGDFGSGPWGQVFVPGLDTFWTQDSPSPLLRREFALKDNVKSAYAVISGLGFYELSINGKKIGDKVLDPVFTNYDKTVLYSTYDITEYLLKGNNAVGIMLANGWYNSHTKDAWDFDKASWREDPKAIMNIVVRYDDGSSETICTDANWLGSNGPLIADAIRSGEVYDARLEQKGWDEPEFDNKGWDSVRVVKAPKGVLRSETMPATKIKETIKPITISQPKEDVYLFDMGVNIAGWVKLKVSGRKGQKITIRYGEKLKDGMLNVGNIRGLTFTGPFQTDTYYLKGEGVEEWHPRFVYHGFRYVEVSGLDSKPTLDTIEAQVVHTDFKTVGEFTCSNELFNTIQKLSDRSYKGNYVGIPTDCPQREKNGWTADAHLAAEMAMCNYNNFLSYEKWLGDFRDDQDVFGRYSCIIPSPGWGARDLTEWDSAYMIITWYLYLYYGDSKVVEDNFGNMKLYIANVEQRIKSNSYIVDFGLGDWANDGGSVTPVPLTATAYFYYDTILMKKFAEILDKGQDAKKFSDLSEKIKIAYNREFYKGGGVYAEGQQTALAMSLYYGLVPESEKAAVNAKLVEQIKEKDNHHDTGILGAKCIFRVLSDIGKTDLAMKMLNQKTRPSYGYWIENGATSLYENWSKDPGSMNHVMYSDISAWFYNYLAGIKADPERPGFKNIIIEPEFADGISWVKSKYKSSYGMIGVDWEVHESEFVCRIQVPVNTEARVVFKSDAIVSTKLVKGDYKDKLYQTNEVVYTIGSGDYTFTGLK